MRISCRQKLPKRTRRSGRALPVALPGLYAVVNPTHSSRCGLLSSAPPVLGPRFGRHSPIGHLSSSSAAKRKYQPCEHQAVHDHRNRQQPAGNGFSRPRGQHQTARQQQHPLDPEEADHEGIGRQQRRRHVGEKEPGSAHQLNDQPMRHRPCGQRPPRKAPARFSFGSSVRIVRGRLHGCCRNDAPTAHGIGRGAGSRRTRFHRAVR